MKIYQGEDLPEPKSMLEVSLYCTVLSIVKTNQSFLL